MTSLESEVEGAILSAAASLIIIWIAYRKGIFSSCLRIPQLLFPPTLLLVAIAFLIYFGINLVLPHLISDLMIRSMFSDRVMLATWIIFITEAITLSCLYLFSRSIYHPISQTIWRRNPQIPLAKDIFVALTACIISFPIILFVGQVFELLVYFIFHTFELPDQNVILFLKMTFGKPLYFLLASLSIIVFTPFIEELLFRGFLQSFLRKYFRPSLAIMLSSAIFAIFHFSFNQGLGNIPIVGSLFILSNLLGYVYERQGSLLSPMILHASFNTLSIINLYFFG